MRRLSLFASVSGLAIAISTGAFAANNTVNLWQYGTDQAATIGQSGSYGLVNLQQDDGAGSTGKNKAEISQSGYANSVGYLGTAKQSGGTNYASITQEGQYGDVELSQVGDNNGQHADWWTNGAPGSIWQDATAYYSTIKLNENSNNAVFNLAQGGSFNLIDVTQGGGNAEAQVVQADDASSSTVTVNQTNGGIPGADAWTYVWLQQAGGASNNINAYQNGYHLGLDVIQLGSNNTFLSSQTGYDNYAGLPAAAALDLFIYQVGSWNYVSNNQSGSGNLANGNQSGFNNQLYNYQYGTNGSLTFNQAYAVSSGNYLYNYQGGDKNAAIVDQEGNGNGITNNQYGSAIELVSATQWGDGNGILTTQSGGAQTATLFQWGTGNQIGGTQSGSANAATVNQVGNYNTANYNQSGTGGVATINQN